MNSPNRSAALRTLNAPTDAAPDWPRGIRIATACRSCRGRDRRSARRWFEKALLQRIPEAGSELAEFTSSPELQQ